ncbi:TPA: hypothetical protein DDW35_08335 [Candidatus Sumerlaeota bacterium]|jgi:hypothetical protein|nr:hypothetical protein [Candidatus Sumerlaeota bacterium]
MKKIILCCTLALLLTAGCSKQQQKDATTASATAATSAKAKLVKEDADFEQMSASDMAKYQRDVRLSARYENGAVRVNVRNMTQGDIGIQFSNFALLLPTQKTTIEATPGSGFPKTVLKPGEFATGLISFSEVNNPVGAYCVFHHSSVQASRCTVRAAKSASADTATSTVTAKSTGTPVVKKSKALPTKSANKKVSTSAVTQQKAKPNAVVKTPTQSTTTESEYTPNPLGE